VSQRIDLVRSSLPSSEQLVLEAVEETTHGVVLRVRAKHLPPVLPVSNVVECRITAATPGECETCHGGGGKLKFICRRGVFDA
jgi:hypothetical protein